MNDSLAGDQVAMYSELNYKEPVTDVDYHPRDHLMALCCLGPNQPILIYNYNSHSKCCSKKEFTLKLFTSILRTILSR